MNCVTQPGNYGMSMPHLFHLIAGLPQLLQPTFLVMG